MAIFMGPDAYVTPSWYATKPESGMVVPTWNYLAVHAYGPVEFFEDAERLLNVVTRLTKLHEEPRALPWAVSDAPADFIAAQLRGIVGVRMPITRIPMTLGLGPGATGHTVAIILAGCATRSVTIFCGHAVVFLTRPMVKLYGKARRWIERTLAAFFGIAAIGLLPFRP